MEEEKQEGTGIKRSFVDETIVKKEISNLIEKKQTFQKNKLIKDEILKDETKTMLRIARHERRGSELDTHELPESDLTIDWREFNTDIKSSRKKYDADCQNIVKAFKNERIDLRPYMIHNPFTATTTDKF